MPDKVKLLTKTEWERGPVPVIPDAEWNLRVAATLDALFRYRERTRGMWPVNKDAGAITFAENAEEAAAELGIE